MGILPRAWRLSQSIQKWYGDGVRAVGCGEERTALVFDVSVADYLNGKKAS